MNVTKYSGELAVFNPEIFKISISKSGANKEQVEKVYEKIDSKLFEGITTRKLYELAFEELHKIRNSFAARYSLKKALRDLGPEGYYFEDWVAKLFNQLGCQATTSKTLQGNAVTHEIDVLAYKNNEFHICECKFRNDIDAKISVTTPMYFLSRFNDLKTLNFNFFGKNLKPTQGWVITNAYFTKDSIAFAEFYNINILSWDYPIGNSIKNIVDTGKLYPITCLTTISDKEKKFLLEKNVILVNDLYSNPKKLEDLNFNEKKIAEILKEANELLAIY